MPTLPVIGQADCITIEGPDARAFAQTQFSGDVERLGPMQWQWNAWLTPQGRVQALMQLVDAGEGRLLALLRGGDVEAVRTALARYLLRSKATLGACHFTVRAGGAQAMGSLHRDGDALLLGLGPRSLRLEAPQSQPAIDAAARDTWRLHDIRAGWPTLPRDGQARFLPQALGLERLGAICFRKGCYPGQEIAARLHFRGGHKSRLCHLQGSAALAPGTFRGQDGRVEATVLDAVTDTGTCDALAIVTTDIHNEINIMENVYRINASFDT